MSLATGFTWSHRGLRLVGYSMAGISTSLVFPDADVCFDVAQGLPFQVPISNILLTHGHSDHASGIPYLIGQKAMTGQTPPTVYMPEAITRPMRELMRVFEELDGHTYQYQFKGISPGQEAPLKAPYFAKPFATYHRVPSQGYTVYERKKTLKSEYKNLDPRELGRLRKEGAALDEFYDDPVISFTGDTKIEFLGSPDVVRSRILVMEVTYWDQKKSVENARLWGHIHLDELIPRLDSIQSEKIVLIHASARYSTRDLKQIIEARIPEHHKSRVELFPRPS